MTSLTVKFLREQLSGLPDDAVVHLCIHDHEYIPFFQDVLLEEDGDGCVVLLTPQYNPWQKFVKEISEC